MMSKGTLGVCAGVAGALFVGYCIYFDNRRRNAPNFRAKLKQKRRRGPQSSTNNTIEWPNLKDQDSVQKFFLEQIQLGEELLASGQIESGVDHLSRAIAVCGQPQQLLQVLNQTLPPRVFQTLVQKLPSVGESVLRAAGGPMGSKVTEEDVE